MPINHSIIGGNLTRDPQIKFTAGNHCVATFSIAANRRWKDSQGEQREDVIFLDCEAWGRTAEIIGQHFNKGKAILLEGRLKQDSWDDKETGKKRTRISLVVERFHFVGSSPSAAPTESAESEPAPTHAPPTSSKRSSNDDEPPF
jgi:single-strand DNA-binding protein